MGQSHPSLPSPRLRWCPQREIQPPSSSQHPEQRPWCWLISLGSFCLQPICLFSPPQPSAVPDQLLGWQPWEQGGQKRQKRGRKDNFKSTLKAAELRRQLIKLTALTETAHCKQQPNKAASSQMADDQATAVPGGGEGESAHESLNESLAPCIPAGLDKRCCQPAMGATHQPLSPQHPCCSAPGGHGARPEHCNHCVGA